MSDVTKGLELLFDRPQESLITPKGDQNALFQLNEQQIPPEYGDAAIELNSRFGNDETEKILLVNLKELPKFPLASQLPTDADFSLFLSKHQAMAAEVIDILMSVPENQMQQFLSTCAFSRTNLNPQLFNYCFTVALLHRNDTKNVGIQNFAESFPSKFLDSKVFSKAREMAAVMPKGVPRTPIIIPRDFSASDLEEEHRLAYFREDIGVNLHHYHWHLVYPFNSSDIKIVAKDRRGELFYYMHQQIIARYNNERLCNALKRVVKFSNWREPIPEAYYPKLDNLTSFRGWPPRQANMKWQDLNRTVDGAVITVSQMEQSRRNVEEAISTGFVVLPDGTSRALDIDTLGNLIEASKLSVNPDHYGSLHNNGHNFTAYIHDPEHRYLESSSVIADEATTMRDPFFYRWHAWIDSICQKYKESSHVRRYETSELENPGIRVTSATIVSENGQRNIVNTFWMQSDVDLSRGLDFSERGPVLVRYTHLNHQRFKYVINVNNTGASRRATVRIFIAPKFDERNLAWMLVDQRKMFIEMDRFVVLLNAGQNILERQSTESTVTIPFEQTFRDLSAQSGGNLKKPSMASFNYCGCGWPQHMLVPKGTEAGSAYQLFVMLSNYELDKIDQADGSDITCKQASSFCGLRDKKYPDKRAMGFPFDRPAKTASNIEDFILPNMALTEFTIRLNNVTVPNPKNPK